MIRKTSLNTSLFFSAAFALCLCGSFILPGARSAIAAESAGTSGWTSWRGPNGNGTIRDAKFNAAFTSGGGRILWKAEVGEGYSALAATDEFVYTAGRTARSGKKFDTVYCLSTANGRTVWSYEYEQKRDYQYPGPRAMPVIYGANLYALGANADLVCLNARSGKVNWTRSLQSEEKFETNTWGISSSPLIENGVIYLNVGGGIALDAASGRTIWKRANIKNGYATPVIFSFKGKRSLMIFGDDKLFLLDAASGSETAQYTWKTSYNVNAPDPLILPGNRVLISSGYGKGSALLDYSTGSFKAVWESKRLNSHFSSLILHDGAVCGVEGDSGQRGRNQLICVDQTGGEVIFGEKTSQYGSIIKVNNTIIFLGEDGILKTYEGGRSSLKAGGQMQVLTGRANAWVAPSYWNGRIYLRSNSGEVVCVKAD